ncbi:MAG: hypothetical protein K5829_09265 [Treponema sp.]|nr:hypothetical protein [Treponema sp.]
MDKIPMAFLGLTVIILSLNIFSYIKRLNILAKISSSLLMPCGGVAISLYLVRFFPDSINVTTITILSFIFSTITVIAFNFDNLRVCRVIGRFCFIASQLCWLWIYYSSFFMYKIPTFATITVITVYLAIIISVFIIIGKKNLIFYIWTGIALFITTDLLYCAVITLSYCRNLYSAIFVTATFITEATCIYYILQTGKFDFKHGNFVRLISYLIAQLTTAATGIIMFTF